MLLVGFNRYLTQLNYVLSLLLLHGADENRGSVEGVLPIRWY